MGHQLRPAAGGPVVLVGASGSTARRAAGVEQAIDSEMSHGLTRRASQSGPAGSAAQPAVQGAIAQQAPAPAAGNRARLGLRFRAEWRGD